jgi:TonB family protein
MSLGDFPKHDRISAALWHWPFFVAFACAAVAQSVPPTSAASAPRLKISEVSTSEFLIQKTPPKYPEASLRAGTEGTVVIDIVIDTSGAVQEATVVSGDPTLAEAAVNAVRQWKYKPYLSKGTAVEIETRATIGFHLKTQSPAGPPPLGTFEDGHYSNEYFHLFYPLSRDWVRETLAVRKRLAAEKPGLYVLLTAVHIPQDNTELRADSSFTVLAFVRSSNRATENCQLYLEALASNVISEKLGRKKGEISQFTAAGRDFYRADFEYRKDVSDRSTICMAEKDYLLLWNIEGWSRRAVEEAVSTLNSLTADPPMLPKLEKSANQVNASGRALTGVVPAARPVQVHLPTGFTTGLLIKKVQPIYPREARNNRIQGTVVMVADISKTGDVVDLEIIDGPIELAVSAVNSVRLWKYRPYALNGEPLAVKTTIQVNYSLIP